MGNGQHRGKRAVSPRSMRDATRHAVRSRRKSNEDGWSLACHVDSSRRSYTQTRALRVRFGETTDRRENRNDSDPTEWVFHSGATLLALGCAVDRHFSDFNRRRQQLTRPKHASYSSPKLLLCLNYTQNEPCLLCRKREEAFEICVQSGKRSK